MGRKVTTYTATSTNMIVTTAVTGDNTITPVVKKEYYNTNGIKTKEEYIDGGNISTVSYTYDYLKNVLTVTDPMNNVTTTTYDYAGNVLSVKNAENKIALNNYDKKGRLVSSVETQPLTPTTSPDTSIRSYANSKASGVSRNRQSYYFHI